MSRTAPGRNMCGRAAQACHNLLQDFLDVPEARVLLQHCLGLVRRGDGHDTACLTPHALQHVCKLLEVLQVGAQYLLATLLALLIRDAQQVPAGQRRGAGQGAAGNTVPGKMSITGVSSAAI